MGSDNGSQFDPGFPFSGHLDTLNAWWHQDGIYFASDPIICGVAVAFWGL